MFGPLLKVDQVKFGPLNHMNKFNLDHFYKWTELNLAQLINGAYNMLHIKFEPFSQVDQIKFGPFPQVDRIKFGPFL